MGKPLPHASQLLAIPLFLLGHMLKAACGVSFYQRCHHYHQPARMLFHLFHRNGKIFDFPCPLSIFPGWKEIKLYFCSLNNFWLKLSA